MKTKKVLYIISNNFSHHIAHTFLSQTFDSHHFTTHIYPYISLYIYIYIYIYNILNRWTGTSSRISGTPHFAASGISKLSTVLLNRVLRMCVLFRPYLMALLHCRHVICSITPKPTLYLFLGSNHCLTHGYGANLWQEEKPLLYQEIFSSL